MFLDPNVLNSTCSVFTTAGPLSFASTERAADHSSYAYSSGTGVFYKLKVSHQYGSRSRVTSRIDVNDTIADPLQPALNKLRSTSLYWVLDADPIGVPTSVMRIVGNMLAGQLVSVAAAAAVWERVLAGET